jgi:hypothetical protein
MNETCSKQSVAQSRKTGEPHWFHFTTAGESKLCSSSFGWVPELRGALHVLFPDGSTRPFQAVMRIVLLVVVTRCTMV